MTEGKWGHGPLFGLSPPWSSPSLIYLPASDLEVEGFFFSSQDECHENTTCADRMALMRTQVSTSSIWSPVRLLLTPSSPLKHCIASFIYHDTDVFRAVRTQLCSLLMEKSLWLYSGGVCGQTNTSAGQNGAKLALEVGWRVHNCYY